MSWGIDVAVALLVALGVYVVAFVATLRTRRQVRARQRQAELNAMNARAEARTPPLLRTRQP